MDIPSILLHSVNKLLPLKMTGNKHNQKKSSGWELMDCPLSVLTLACYQIMYYIFYWFNILY